MTDDQAGFLLDLDTAKPDVNWDRSDGLSRVFSAGVLANAAWRDISAGADALATGGVAQHTNDHGAGALRERAAQRVRRHWKYFLSVYTIVRGLERQQAGLARRCKPL